MKNKDIALKLTLKKEQDLAKEKEKKALQLKRGQVGTDRSDHRPIIERINDDVF